MPEKIIPFVGPPNQRATGTNDRRFVNVFFESVPNPSTKTQEVYCTKRPGLANDTQPTGASTGRGIYAWAATGSTYSVFGNVLYSGTTSTLAMNTSSGRVWFEETPALTGERLLIVSDGQDNYHVSTDGVVIQIDQSADPNYPVSNLGPVSYLDAYLFQGQSNGNIINTRQNSFSSWAAANLTRDSRKGDALEAHHVIGDQLLVFGKNSMGSFYNAGNPFGSPLLRVEQNSQDFGMAAKETMAWSGQRLCFVAENSARGDGGRSVVLIEGGGGGKEISPPAINRFLTDEGLSISSASAWMERVAGYVVYVLNLRAADRTFVYSIESNMWSEWEAAGGGRFPGVSATSINGTLYIQDESNGRIYAMSPTTYRDSGSDFTVTMQLERLTYSTDKRKKQSELALLADRTTGHVSTSWSDDDFVTFTTPRTIDMALSHKRLTRLGSFRERSYRFEYADNSTFRAQAAKHVYEMGQS